MDDALFAKIMTVVERDLDPTTLEIVRELLADGHRLSVIRDAFMEGKDALAVKMLRDLDPYRTMGLLPISTAFIPNGLAPTQSMQVIARPQICPFRPRYLLLAKETATSIDLNEIRVGHRSQFVQSGDLPGEIFGVDLPEATLDAVHDEGLDPVDPVSAPVYVLRVEAKGMERLPLPIDFEPVQVGQDLVLIVTNISTQPLSRFRGAFIGATLAHD